MSSGCILIWLYPVMKLQCENPTLESTSTSMLGGSFGQALFKLV